jgi:hypothetical protein
MFVCGVWGGARAKGFMIFFFARSMMGMRGVCAAADALMPLLDLESGLYTQYARVEFVYTSYHRSMKPGPQGQQAGKKKAPNSATRPCPATVFKLDG